MVLKLNYAGKALNGLCRNDGADERNASPSSEAMAPNSQGK